MENYLENLARAYNENLHGSENPTLSQMESIINEQIYLLSRLPQGNKIVGYLLSLKECTKNIISKNKKPSPRHLPREGGINRIIGLELELLTLLDNVLDDGLDKVREYENRALSLLCYLGK
ncbi:MAG: hypothetical protein IJ033_02500 [Clostridia bacterium]|nr:hypothetical protein [Clostridia bacterium]